jgi:dolichyl-phosphate beta-glucosyltransferase
MQNLNYTKPDFLIVIPCFREADRLPLFLATLCSTLTNTTYNCVIRVVDDGSGSIHAERTSKIVNDLRKDFPILLEPLLLEPNQGKGGAVYAGWNRGPESEWLAFADADGATPAYEVARLFRYILAHENNTDAFIASRIKMLGRTIRRSPIRHIMGRVFATLAVLLTGLPVYDSQCGCKVIRRSAFVNVKPNLSEEQFGFDMDLLMHLSWHGSRIEEFPVDWLDQKGSKVSFPHDTIKMFFSLIRLKKKCMVRNNR